MRERSILLIRPHSNSVLWNSFKRITARYSATGKAKLYHDTAARVYRLG